MSYFPHFKGIFALTHFEESLVLGPKLFFKIYWII